MNRKKLEYMWCTLTGSRWTVSSNELQPPRRNKSSEIGKAAQAYHPALRRLKQPTLSRQAPSQTSQKTPNKQTSVNHCRVFLQLVSLSDLLLLGLSLEGCFESAISALRPGRLPLAGQLLAFRVRECVPFSKDKSLFKRDFTLAR